MKRLITLLALSTALAGAAGAHTLDAGAGMASQLWHELLGGHHLPLTLLLVVVGVLAYRGLRARRNS
jgi:hypothetical protein